MRGLRRNVVPQRLWSLETPGSLLSPQVRKLGGAERARNGRREGGEGKKNGGMGDGSPGKGGGKGLRNEGGNPGPSLSPPS